MSRAVCFFLRIVSVLFSFDISSLTLSMSRAELEKVASYSCLRQGVLPLQTLELRRLESRSIYLSYYSFLTSLEKAFQVDQFVIYLFNP